MLNIFSSGKKRDNQRAKEAVLKEFFSSSEQKKAVTKAARESAKDQKILIEKYNKLVNVVR